MTVLRISQLAERSGVPATTLRFYESEGLLPAGRTPAGYRVYGDEAVARLEFIGAAKQLGLPLAEIGELLAVRESGACAEVKADLRPRLAASLADVNRRIAELTLFAESLRAARDRLAALPDRAEPRDAECGLHPAPPTRDVACSLTAGKLGDRTELHLDVRVPDEGAAMLADLFGQPTT